MATGVIPPRKGGRKLRSIRIEGDFAYVPLTKGYEAKIDIADVPLVERRNWSALVVGKVKKRVYAVYTGFALRAGENRPVYMHRIMCDGGNVDHQNHDTLDNTRRNLRPCSIRQNNYNIGVRSDSFLQVKGVYPDRRSGGFRTAVRLDGKTVFHGHFDTIEEARIAYDREARKAFGDFAFVNGAGSP